jgi:hypothetical protein
MYNGYKDKIREQLEMRDATILFLFVQVSVMQELTHNWWIDKSTKEALA